MFKPALQRLRRSLRAKALRVVDEVVGRYHLAQAEELRRQVTELGEELRREIHREGARAARRHEELGRQVRGQATGLVELREDLRQEIREQARSVVGFTKGFEIRTRRDLVYAADQHAAAESSRFCLEAMPTAPHFPHPNATLEYALSLAADTDGMACEFGVWTGTTLKIIAAAREGKQVFGFDSFQGLPETWRSGFPAGAFSVDGLPDVPGAELVVGWFDQTLPAFLAEHPGPVAFVHIDSDLYSSARTVLHHVGPRLRAGSVIVFDEYFNYPGWRDHEHRAWQEYAAESGVQFQYEAYTHDNEQVVIRVTAT